MHFTEKFLSMFFTELNILKQYHKIPLKHLTQTQYSMLRVAQFVQHPNTKKKFVSLSRNMRQENTYWRIVIIMSDLYRKKVSGEKFLTKTEISIIVLNKYIQGPMNTKERMTM